MTSNSIPGRVTDLLKNNVYFNVFYAKIAISIVKKQTDVTVVRFRVE